MGFQVTEAWYIFALIAELIFNSVSASESSLGGSKSFVNGTNSWNVSRISRLDEIHSMYDDLMSLGETREVNSCISLMEILADAASDFIKCAGRNARPIKVCERCGANYLSATKTYENILNTVDKVDGRCDDFLLNADRVQVLRFIYSSLNNVWSSLQCSLCFIQEEVNGVTVLSPTNNTLQFLHYMNKTMECLYNATGDQPLRECEKCNHSVCEMCANDYRRLNNFYNELVANEDFLCMDLVDLMNTSRTMWSRRYFCLQHKNSLTYLYIVTTFVLILPVMLYFWTWIASDGQVQVIIPQKRLVHAQTLAASTSSYQK